MTPAKPATVRCAADLTRNALKKARTFLHITYGTLVDRDELATLAIGFALAEQQKDFNEQLAELRAECESKRREWRDGKMRRADGVDPTGPSNQGPLSGASDGSHPA